MSLPYTSGDFTTPRAGTESWVEYPFIAENDNVTKVYHLVCVVNEANYTPIALDTTMANVTNAGVIDLPFGADSTAYFVGDYNKTKIEGGLVIFDRQFAKIPASRSLRLTGTSAYTFPGIEADRDNTIVRTVTSYTFTANTSTFYCSNTVSVGDPVICSLNTTDPQTGITIDHNRINRTALSGTNSTRVVVDKMASYSYINSVSLEQFAILPRNRSSLATGTFTDFTYYLPGVSSGITAPTDVPLSETFRTPDALLSDATIPSATEYDAKVTNGELLLIDSSITKYAGNIIQRANVKVKAQ